MVNVHTKTTHKTPYNAKQGPPDDSRDSGLGVIIESYKHEVNRRMKENKSRQLASHLQLKRP